MTGNDQFLAAVREESQPLCFTLPGIAGRACSKSEPQTTEVQVTQGRLTNCLK